MLEFVFSFPGCQFYLKLLYWEILKIILLWIWISAIVKLNIYYEKTENLNIL